MKKRESNEEEVSRPYFVIYSQSRQCIWQKPYASQEEAVQELQEQLAKLQPEVRDGQDWVVEKHERNHPVVKIKVGVPTGPVDDGWHGF